MEANMHRNNTNPMPMVAPREMRDAAQRARTPSPESGGRVRHRLVSGWHFTRHLLAMVVAMFTGMAMLGLALGALGEPPGYANLLVKYSVMGAAMALPMVAWMRYRGHTWSDGVEMTLAMLVPLFAVVLPVAVGIAGLSDHALMLLTHVAMIGGMVALMLYRWDRYAHGVHHRHA
jgi:hypothetical protein